MAGGAAGKVLELRGGIPALHKKALVRGSFCATLGVFGQARCTAKFFGNYWGFSPISICIALSLPLGTPNPNSTRAAIPSPLSAEARAWTARLNSETCCGWVWIIMPETATIPAIARSWRLKVMVRELLTFQFIS